MSQAEKIFVLDTNVLLHDACSLHAFGNNRVVIPIFVIEELDQFKRDMSELGRNARAVSRELDGLRQQGSLTEGVSTEQGGIVQVWMLRGGLLSTLGTSNSMDNCILSVAMEVKAACLPQLTTFISKDINLRIRADALGLCSEDFEPDRTEITELYPGHTFLETDASQVDEFWKPGAEFRPSGEHSLSPNEYVQLRDMANPMHASMGRFDAKRGVVLPLSRSIREGVWGIRPRNLEQNYLLDLLLCDEVQLVTVVGKAGTGKTLLALAAGLQKVTEEGKFQKLLVSRPVFPLGRDIGFLPGDIEEKLTPWMQPIFDNVEFLLNLSSSDKREGRGSQELFDLGILQIEPLTYIRGRSIPQQFILVDEAQNLTPHEAKTILSRAGEGTKVVLTGDPYQIDNPYVDSTNNGLVHVVRRFRQEPIAGHMTLSKGERSPLAELAANLL
ncbi:MAG: PhoH family protein [Cystobacterineae bacterium]|nr:PhoH family protein [Cystobacterineae bacterium]